MVSTSALFLNLPTPQSRFAGCDRRPPLVDTDLFARHSSLFHWFFICEWWDLCGFSFPLLYPVFVSSLEEALCSHLHALFLTTSCTLMV